MTQQLYAHVTAVSFKTVPSSLMAQTLSQSMMDVRAIII